MELWQRPLPECCPRDLPDRLSTFHRRGVYEEKIAEPKAAAVVEIGLLLVAAAEVEILGRVGGPGRHSVRRLPVLRVAFWLQDCTSLARGAEDDSRRQVFVRLAG